MTHNEIIVHYKKFFDLHAKGIALDEDDHLNIDWAQDLIQITPIKDRQTKENLRLGDRVENEKGQCGTLAWDDYMNRYLIRADGGGNIPSRTYTKLAELHENDIDTTRTECRSKPSKKKW